MGILNEDMKRVIRQQRIGFVATVCPDGTPNLSPKGTAAVWDDDHLLFADLASPVTMANLRQNPAVEINLVDLYSRKGYRFKGAAHIVEKEKEPELHAEIFQAYEHGRPGRPPGAAAGPGLRADQGGKGPAPGFSGPTPPARRNGKPGKNGRNTGPASTVPAWSNCKKRNREGPSVTSVSGPPTALPRRSRGASRCAPTLAGAWHKARALSRNGTRYGWALRVPQQKRAGGEPALTLFPNPFYP